MTNTRLFYKLSNILKLLENMNISTIALKGAYIAGALYPAIALRPMRDIDLLTKNQDIVKLHNALSKLGWKGELPDQHQQAFRAINYSKLSFSLGLHSQIDEIAAMDPWSYTFSTNQAETDVYRVLYFFGNELGENIPASVLAKLNENKPKKGESDSSGSPN